MIVVGPTGDVVRIFGDGLPTTAELRAVLVEAAP